MLEEKCDGQPTTSSKVEHSAVKWPTSAHVINGSGHYGPFPGRWLRARGAKLNIDLFNRPAITLYFLRWFTTHVPSAGSCQCTRQWPLTSWAQHIFHPTIKLILLKSLSTMFDWANKLPPQANILDNIGSCTVHLNSSCGQQNQDFCFVVCRNGSLALVRCTGQSPQMIGR